MAWTEPIHNHLSALVFQRRNVTRWGTGPIPDLNVALLSKVMDHIEAHPEEHNQDEWAVSTPCGTAFCFAGHAVNMTMQPQDRFLFLATMDKQAAMSVRISGEDRPIAQEARRVLGLTRTEAATMFSGSNTREKLRAMVDALIEAEGQRLVHLAE